MSWRNIRLVWMRELRDQLRDRRTLFMVAVLPLLMYPLMGMSFLQLSQFMQSHRAVVAVVGAEALQDSEGLPPLVDRGRFAAGLFDASEDADGVLVERVPDAEGALAGARQRLAHGGLDAVVAFPEGFVDRLNATRAALAAWRDGHPDRVPADLQAPGAVIYSNQAREESQVAALRVERLLNRWRAAVTVKNLRDFEAPESIASTFTVDVEDVATAAERKASLWARLLPFVVFVWALTGAFYPAVDLCAGEKERGTLETLLASPALRSEIVCGKLLTVMVFSMATSLLNLASLGLTGTFLLSALQGANGNALIGMPPLAALGWLVVAMPPMSAMFSALSLACASFARSTKEGQYYFMPLFLLTMPLMLLPVSPGVELTPGNSLVPIMGVVLLLRTLIEGNLLEAARYFLPVTAVTLFCCLLSIRWAVAQFNQESVLFREGERFHLGIWLRRLVSRPTELPTAAMAVAVVVAIFLAQLTIGPLVARLTPWLGSPDAALVAAVLASQGAILLPPLLAAVALTRRPLHSLRLDRPAPAAWLALAPALALALHPVGMELVRWIQWAYPLSDQVREPLQEAMAQLTGGGIPRWGLVLLLGALPAVCEELAFRGFVLTGLRQSTSAVESVALSAVAFGLAHQVFQQSLSAAVLGLLLGYFALRGGSLWPCVIFHATYNSLGMLSAYFAEPLLRWLGRGGWDWLLRTEAGHFAGYHPLVVGLSALGAVGLIVFLELTRPSRPLVARPSLGTVPRLGAPHAQADVGHSASAPADLARSAGWRRGPP